MTYQEILEELKTEIAKVQEDFKKELLEIRAGRLSPGLVEDIKVECFGSILPLKQLGIISMLSSREILIQLWDRSYLESVLKAIQEKQFGLAVRSEANSIHLCGAPLTRESKEALVKLLNQKREEVFQRIRHLRDKAWKEIQEAARRGEVREDDKYRGKDKLEELVKEHREKIEKTAENKKKEIEG